MSTKSAPEPATRAPLRVLTPATVIVLTVWAAAVLVDLYVILSTVVQMGYFEWTPGARAEYEAAAPWHYAGLVASFVLAGAALWMRARWWQTIMVAAPGIIAGSASLIWWVDPLVPTLLSLAIATIGLVLVLFTARPFGRPRT